MLIVDNDAAHAEAMAESLERVGYECTVATTGPEGRPADRARAFDIVITDLVMNDVTAWRSSAAPGSRCPTREVILVTGHATIPTAVEAMQQGAFNFLEKPLDLKPAAGRRREGAATRSGSSGQNVELQRRLDEQFGFEGIIGTSPQMNDVIDRLQADRPDRRHAC